MYPTNRAGVQIPLTTNHNPHKSIKFNDSNIFFDSDCEGNDNNDDFSENSPLSNGKLHENDINCNKFNISNLSNKENNNKNNSDDNIINSIPNLINIDCSVSNDISKGNNTVIFKHIDSNIIENNGIENSVLEELNIDSSNIEYYRDNNTNESLDISDISLGNTIWGIITAITAEPKQEAIGDVALGIVTKKVSELVSALSVRSDDELGEEPAIHAFEALINLSWHPDQRIRDLIADMFPRLYALNPEHAGAMSTMLMVRCDPSVEKKVLNEELVTLEGKAVSCVGKNEKITNLPELKQIAERKEAINRRLKQIEGSPAIPDDFLPPVFLVAIGADGSNKHCTSRAGEIVKKLDNQLPPLETLANFGRTVSPDELARFASHSDRVKSSYIGVVNFDTSHPKKSENDLVTIARRHGERVESDPNAVTVFTIHGTNESMLASVFLYKNTLAIVGNIGNDDEDQLSNEQEGMMLSIKDHFRKINTDNSFGIEHIEARRIDCNILGNDLKSGNSILGIYFSEYEVNKIMSKEYNNVGEIVESLAVNLDKMSQIQKKREDIELRMEIAKRTLKFKQ